MIFTSSTLETVNDAVIMVTALCTRVPYDINQWPYRHETLILKSKRNVAKFWKQIEAFCDKGVLQSHFAEIALTEIVFAQMNLEWTSEKIFERI